MESIKIQPLGKRILVKREEISEKTLGGLVIPPSATDEKKPAYGIVAKLGIGKDDKGNAVKFEVKVGDKVYFKRYSPEEINIDNEEYLILDEEDILAIEK